MAMRCLRFTAPASNAIKRQTRPTWNAALTTIWSSGFHMPLAHKHPIARSRGINIRCSLCGARNWSHARRPSRNGTYSSIASESHWSQYGVLLPYVPITKSLMPNRIKANAARASAGTRLLARTVVNNLWSIN